MRMRAFYDSICTRLIFMENGVSHADYKTNGVPMVIKRRHSLEKILIGKNFRMNNGLSANCIGYSTPCIFLLQGGGITIGDNVGMSQTTIIAMDNVLIGNHVLIGGGTKIYTSDFHPLNYIKRREPQNWEYAKCMPVILEDDCFIGAGTIILKGVTIGARSVIGAGSVVTKNIPSDCIAAGNPCKVIRKLNEIDVHE